MLFYTTPVLAILTVFVAYELLRRSQNALVSSKGFIRHSPSQWIKDAEMRKMNPPKETTLEEEVIGVMAPIGKGESILSSSPNTSSFVPAHDKIAGASMIS
jgi:hypothetical protein